MWQSELPRAEYAKTVKRTVDCRYGCTKKKCERMRFRDKRRKKRTLLKLGSYWETSLRTLKENTSAQKSTWIFASTLCKPVTCISDGWGWVNAYLWHLCTCLCVCVCVLFSPFTQLSGSQQSAAYGGGLERIWAKVSNSPVVKENFWCSHQPWPLSQMRWW